MDSHPLVSVVVPVFNAGRYLEECLDSLLNQTLQEIEVICIDDGSTDESPAILEAKALKDSRLKVFHQANAGVSAARNRGMSAARGKYLTFVDADDRIDLQTLGYLCFEAERLQTDILLFNYAKVENGKYRRCALLDEIFSRFGDAAFSFAEGEELLYFVHGTTVGRFYRREILERNRLEFPVFTSVGEDFVFWIEAMLTARRFAVCNQIFYFYRKDNENSLSKQFSSLGQQILQGYEGLRQRLMQKLAPETFRRINFYVLDRNMISFVWNYSALPTEEDQTVFRAAMKKLRTYIDEYGEEERQKFRHLKEFEHILKPHKKKISLLGVKISYRSKR